MFEIIQTFYWLAISTWFGGMLFMLIAVPMIFRSIEEAKPILPNVLSVNLENQHASLLGGSVVGKLFQIFTRVELACAGGMIIAIIGQWLLLKPAGPQLISALMRAAMLIAATALLLYDWRIVWPKIWKYRQQYLDHADEPEIANPALDEFNRHQAENVLLLRIRIGALLGIVLYSGMISKPVTLVTNSLG